MRGINVSGALMELDIHEGVEEGDEVFIADGKNVFSKECARQSRCIEKLLIYKKVACAIMQ